MRGRAGRANTGNKGRGRGPGLPRRGWLSVCPSVCPNVPVPSPDGPRAGAERGAAPSSEGKDKTTRAVGPLRLCRVTWGGSTPPDPSVGQTALIVWKPANYPCWRPSRERHRSGDTRFFVGNSLLPGRPPRLLSFAVPLPRHAPNFNQSGLRGDGACGRRREWVDSTPPPLHPRPLPRGCGRAFPPPPAATTRPVMGGGNPASSRPPIPPHGSPAARDGRAFLPPPAASPITSTARFERHHRHHHHHHPRSPPPPVGEQCGARPGPYLGWGSAVRAAPAGGRPPSPARPVPRIHTPPLPPAAATAGSSPHARRGRA